KLFGIRSCNEVITGDRPRPCLEYDIHRCIAPCVREICSGEQYAAAVADTRLFLEGRNDELVAQLRGRMADDASEERFEQAAQLRDAIRTIETVQQRQQKMAGTGHGDRDAFGIKVGPAGAVVQVFQVRSGKVVERIELASTDAVRSPSENRFPLSDIRYPITDIRYPITDNRYPITDNRNPISDNRNPISDNRNPKTDGRWTTSEGPVSVEAEILQAALEQFYAERAAPPEIHVPIELPPAEIETVEAWLTDKSEHRVRLVVPKRGERRGLLDLAARNAQVAYQTRFNETVAAHYDALETLRLVLNLGAIPRRIECFDISTIHGSETVASMVVCEDG